MADRVFSGNDVVHTWGREVLYPEIFSGVQPDGNPLTQPDNLGNTTYDVPIAYLSHITHKQEAIQITGRAAYTFLPRQKFGKTEGGTTFTKIEDDQYEIIPGAAPVFPGEISWWGISYREEGFQTDVMEPIRDEVGGNHVYEVDILKNPPESRYGDQGFIFSWKNIIANYKESRKDCEKKVVYLKKAGTLRYYHEICYVVMVIMQEDLNNEEIGALPSMYGEPKFIDNGCINEGGELVNENIPQFHIEHPIAWYGGNSYDWEGLVFAFYFPKGEDQSLQCPLDDNAQEVVAHNPRFCSRGAGACPYNNV